MTTRSIIILLIVLISGAGAGRVGITELLNGTYVVSFQTAEGEVKVFLPDDMAVGDTVSASIFSYPAGTTQAAKSENLSVLEGYTVQAGVQKAPVGQGAITLNIPRNLSGSSLRITLRDQSNRELSYTSVSVRLPDLYSERPQSTTPFDYECPLIGQAGRPIEISGPFDGDFTTTGLSAGGGSVNLLAESPRKLLFEAPPDIQGSTELVLNEKDVVVKRPFTSLRVVKIGEEASSRAARVTPEEYDAPVQQAATAPAVEREIEIEEEVVAVEQSPQNSGIIERELVLESAGVEEKENVLQTGAVPKRASVNAELAIMLAKQLNAPLKGGSMLIKAQEIDTVAVRETKTSDEPGRAETLSAVPEEIIEGNIPVEEKSGPPDTTGESSDDASYSSRELIERIYESSKADWGKPAPRTARRPGSDTPLSEKKLDVMPGDESAPAGEGKYTVQVASFRDASVAEGFAEQLRHKGYRVTVVEADIPSKGRWSRVRVGTFTTKRQAREYGDTLKRIEPGIKSVYITEIR